MIYRDYEIYMRMGKYYVDDIRFDSLQEAHRYIDKRKKHLSDLKNKKK